MMNMKRRVLGILGVLVMMAIASPGFAGANAAESKRMERAKDLIADEQWVRAIDELKAAAADPRETNKDEALFWLAHSQNQAHDSAAAVETIRRLESEFPVSRWVKPAQSLRIEIAQRLQRNDVLWWAAAPPPPSPRPVTMAPPARVLSPAPVPPDVVPAPFTPAPAIPKPRAPAKAIPPPPSPAVVPAAPMPPRAWVPQGYFPDTDQRIQALAFLIRTDAPKVIPMLKSIALESADGSDARRALMVLAQSGQPEARQTVVEVAKTGPEPVRLVAVRELGRFGGPAIVDDLVQVYSTSNERVKYQVVNALGQREAAPALLHIVKSERDRGLRDTAIVTLGEVGGRQQLADLYRNAAADAKRPIIVGLFNAHGEDELIRIAEHERDPEAREEAIARLRLLGTPKARAYLARHR
jgi:hypothetical protein